MLSRFEQERLDKEAKYRRWNEKKRKFGNTGKSRPKSHLSPDSPYTHSEIISFRTGRRYPLAMKLKGDEKAFVMKIKCASCGSKKGVAYGIRETTLREILSIASDLPNSRRGGKKILGSAGRPRNPRGQAGSE